MRAVLVPAVALAFVASACSSQELDSANPTAPAAASTASSTSTAPTASHSAQQPGKQPAGAGTATGRCAPEQLDAPSRRSPAVDPGMLYDGILDYAPYRSLRAMVDASDFAVLGEVASWRAADPGHPRRAAVMTLAITRQFAPADASMETLDIRFWRSHTFGSTGQRSLMSLDGKRAALPPAACVIAVGSPGPTAVLTPRGLAPQGLMIERADGSFTGARVPRQDFGGWVPRGTPRSEEFAALVRRLQSGAVASRTG